MVKMGNFGFIQGYDYIVKVFALYHGMSEEEVRDYFDKSGKLEDGMFYSTIDNISEHIERICP